MLIPAIAVLLAVSAPAAAVAGPPCWPPPVDAPIVDHFRAPACPWCPGNRGVTYAVASGTAVRAVAAGVITFAGSVAGTGYVVLQHADGRRATYGGVAGTGFRVGQPVAAGSIVGWVERGELHFGLRRGEEYLDPAPFIGRLVDRPRLVPTDGTAARPAPPPVLRCAVGGPRRAAVW